MLFDYLIDTLAQNLKNIDPVELCWKLTRFGKKCIFPQNLSKSTATFKKCWKRFFFKLHISLSLENLEGAFRGAGSPSILRPSSDSAAMFKLPGKTFSFAGKTWRHLFSVSIQNLESYIIFWFSKMHKNKRLYKTFSSLFWVRRTLYCGNDFGPPFITLLFCMLWMDEKIGRFQFEFSRTVFLDILYNFY